MNIVGIKGIQIGKIYKTEIGPVKVVGIYFCQKDQKWVFEARPTRGANRMVEFFASEFKGEV